MKNIGLLFSTLCLFAGLGANQAKAADDKANSPTGATIKLQIERKEITKEAAAALVASGEKVELGVYVIFSKEWAPVMEQATADVAFYNSEISWAFYETEAYSNIVNSLDPSHYLQNPTDYIKICAASDVPGKPSDACTLPNLLPDDWYGSTFYWQKFGWPTYAWGGAFVGGVINIGRQYAEKQSDGSYKIKVYGIQFVLKQANRSLPVGFLDDNNSQIDVSGSNCFINPVKGDALYWPAGQSTCPGQTLCQDWTDLKQTSYFEFIPGGLFIQNGPDVETFEPYSES